MVSIFRKWNIFKKDKQIKKNPQKSLINLDNTLASANIGQEYIVKSIETEDEEIKNFLFTLGCYEGESISLISILSDQYIVVIKDARYSIDKNLASCIRV